MQTITYVFKRKLIAIQTEKVSEESCFFSIYSVIQMEKCPCTALTSKEDKFLGVLFTL